MRDHLNGFTLTRERLLTEIDATLYEFTHDQTGLSLIWLKRADENKTFAIAFRTLPWDDTGVFHILEHSVLNGSVRYPVREPFVELMKGSLNTFLNALTFPDKTCYPISSRNEKDFFNLMRVYLDAVFCPLIYERRETFEQEGWHWELDEDGIPSYKGVVFNEMKGALASPDELSGIALYRLMFPDSPYRFVSGGDPEKIPDLTYEQFLDAHRRCYAPSNGYIFLDGDLNIEEVLRVIDSEYLCKYQNTGRLPLPEMQAPVTGEAVVPYELAPGEEPEGKVRLCWEYAVGRFDERLRLNAASILASALTSTNDSPLQKAILSEGLAEEVNMGLSEGIMQPCMSLEVRNLREEDITRTEQLLRDTLRRLSEEGLDHDQLLALIAHMEFRFRERDFSGIPEGLVLGIQAFETWLYDGDPADNLTAGDLFDQLRQMVEEGGFERLIQELLLDNTHYAKVTLIPSATAGEERRAREQARLTAEAAAWTEAEKADIRARQENLLRRQQTPDTPEELATIPQLTLADIPLKPEDYPTQVQKRGDITLLTHPQQTNGIVYARLIFDAGALTLADFSTLSFACALLRETDTTAHTALEVFKLRRLLCGFLSANMSFNAMQDGSTGNQEKFTLSFSALKGNLFKALDLALEILTQFRFDGEKARLILRQLRNDMQQQLMMDGTSLAKDRVTAQFQPEGVLEDATSGLGFYAWLKEMDEHWDFDRLNAAMTDLLRRLTTTTGLVVSLTGADEAQTEALLNRLREALPALPEEPKVNIATLPRRAEGITTPTDVAFAAVGGSMQAHGWTYNGAWQLAAKIISLEDMWNVVRVQGGAYGAGLSVRSTGMVFATSYRDPNGADTVAHTRQLAAFLREWAQSHDDYTGMIIGAVADTSPLMTPRSSAFMGDYMYLTGLTYEELCRRREQLLHATKEDLMAIADQIEALFAEPGICLVGGAEQLARCTSLTDIITP